MIKGEASNANLIGGGAVSGVLSTYLSKSRGCELAIALNIFILSVLYIKMIYFQGGSMQCTRMNPETECPKLDCPKDKILHIHGECCPICEGK